MIGRARAAALAAVALAMIAAAVWFGRQTLTASTTASIPTTRVQRGPVQVKVFTTGELRAARSAQMIAPPIGGNLQVVELAQSGD